jgi:hypothetical protein
MLLWVLRVAIIVAVIFAVMSLGHQYGWTLSKGLIVPLAAVAIILPLALRDES